MSIIDVKDFSFTYPNGKKVIDSLSFSLEKGEVLLLCGKNGCGKSTLLRSLKKEVAPKGTAQGNIALSGTCHILFQDCDKNIIFRSAYEDLIFPACNYGMPEETIKAKADEVLNLFGIAHLKHRDTGTLSGGEKQILSLAALFIMAPDILLLDEPLSQLDEEAKAAFLQKLMLVKHSGTAIVIAEHNTDFLLEKSEKVLIFDEGKNTVYTKDNLAGAPHFPNFPEYITLQKKLGMVPTHFTTAEATDNLKHIADTLTITSVQVPRAEKTQLIECSDLAFSYEQTPVLNGLNFTLRRGEIAFICGRNGAGKTTLLNLICGFEKPQQGVIHLEKGHKIGYLAQNPLYSFLKDTLIEDYRFVLKKNKLEENRLLSLLEHYKMFADLKALYEQNPLDLSGGERAKAALFKLLLIGRDILILDEPEKHLDKNSIAELSLIIKELAAQGFSFIVVSHSPDFIYNTASTVSVIENGTLTAYRREAYFPAHCKTSLYKAIEPAGLPLYDVKEAEVSANG